MQRRLGVWIHTRASAHVQTLRITTQTAQYWETQSHSDSFPLPFPPEGGKNTPVYVCFPPTTYLFSSPLPPFLLFSKESQPLALILPPLCLCGRDGGWWELTWWWLCPHHGVNVTPGMPSVYAGPNGTQCKVLHCGGRVGEAESCEGEIEERDQLQRESDGEMQNGRDVSTRCRGKHEGGICNFNCCF